MELDRPQRADSAGEDKRAKVTAYLLDWQEGERERKRPAVVICPGGGYHRLSPREGEPVAMEYLAMGYHAFVLWYTVAPGRFPQGLLELASLVAHIRDHGEEWGVDPEKIVVRASGLQPGRVLEPGVCLRAYRAQGPGDPA